MTYEDDPPSIAEKLFAAYNGRNLEAVARLYHDDATHEDVAHGKPKIGAMAISEGLGRFLGWFPDASWEIHSIIGGKCHEVAVAYTLRGSLQAPMGPVLPTGQAIALRGVQVLWVAQGRIRRSEDYWDASTFQKQLTSIKPEEKQ
ncbi:nuclear transport factor 2 family protein [Rhizobium sp. LjRoot258]|jgi:steroid delta-isomerase-like uncharacterized protein|uniref:nuclear transport factor 2 family protein n=1 Tax=Rhizobium sp. LjRoot258 TaxID=3342299 RepID=UPI003ECD7254